MARRRRNGADGPRPEDYAPASTADFGASLTTPVSVPASSSASALVPSTPTAAAVGRRGATSPRRGGRTAVLRPSGGMTWAYARHRIVTRAADATGGASVLLVVSLLFLPLVLLVGGVLLAYSLVEPFTSRRADYGKVPFLVAEPMGSGDELLGRQRLWGPLRPVLVVDGTPTTLQVTRRRSSERQAIEYVWSFYSGDRASQFTSVHGLDEVWTEQIVAWFAARDIPFAVYDGDTLVAEAP